MSKRFSIAVLGLLAGFLVVSQIALADGAATRASIVSLAKQQVGKPYSMDLDKRLGPNYFDCSGLIWYCYTNSGVVVDNSILDWVAYPITYSELLPGDLLYVNYYTRPGYPFATGDHVGMYIGNGEVIHAKNTASGVVREPFSPTYWTWAGRIPAEKWPDGDNGCPYAVDFGASSAVPVMTAGNSYQVAVRLFNKGPLLWPASGVNAVYLSYYWVERTTGKIIRTAATPRLPLAADTPYHGKASVEGYVTAPVTPGSYVLRFDMVHNGHGYFSDRFCKTLDKEVTVLANSFFDEAATKTVTSTTLAGFSDGPPLWAKHGTLLKGCSTAAVYVIDYRGGVYCRKPFPDAATFEGLGYRWEDIITVPDEDLAAYLIDPEGPASLGRHSNGSLVKTAASSGIFYLNENHRYGVSLASFESNRFRWDRVSTIGDSEMSSYTIGGAWPLRDGTAIKGSGATVYLTARQNGVAVKRPIASGDVFLALGYHWGGITKLPDSELPPIDGAPVTSVNPLPDGLLIRTGPSNPVYLIENGRKRRLSSAYGYYDAYAASFDYGFGAADIGTSRVGTQVSTSAGVGNPGIMPWKSAGNGGVYVSYHWFDLETGASAADDSVAIRSLFGAGVPSFGSGSTQAQVLMPDTPGFYLLQWDLAQETAAGANWFNSNGASSYSVPVRVHPDYPNGTLVKSSDSAAVYCLENNRKRPVSLAAFLSRGYGWNDIMTLSKTEMASYTLGTQLDIRTGTAIKATGPGVYVVETSGTSWKRYSITSESMLFSMGLGWQEVYSVSDTELAQYTQTGIANPIPARNGALLRSAGNPAVFFIDSGVKRAVSYASFVSNGFRWDRVQVITDAELAGLETGAQWPITAGELVKPDNASGVYVLDYSGTTTSRRLITSAKAFDILGYGWSNIITIGSAELNRYQSGSSY